MQSLKTSLVSIATLSASKHATASAVICWDYTTSFVKLVIKVGKYSVFI